MDRNIDIENDKESLNEWILKSINLFSETNYLDRILEVYPFQIATPERLDRTIRRKIINAHQSRRTEELIEIFKSLTKFPYEDPIWYLLKNIKGCIDNNPAQVQRIANSLYSMTAEETVVRLESAPKLNTQMGPMFAGWLRRRFEYLPIDEFENNQNGICVLDASEEVGKTYINNILMQNLDKRPDLIAKVNRQLIIGEAKWIGQPGGNQEKQVQEVIKFCKNQRGNVIRIGIVDGFPWALYNSKNRLVNNKEAVNIQESEYDIISALLLEEYLQKFL